MKIDFDINSNDNSLFVTSQCNNRCLMCAQPPLDRDDIDFFFERNIRLIDNAPNGLTDIGITGGIIGKTKSTIFQNEKFKKLDKG